MSLIDRMETELKEAMLEQDNDRRDALRLILASLRSAEKELAASALGRRGAAGAPA